MPERKSAGSILRLILLILFARETVAVDIVAHRGFSCGDFENTRDSVENAWSMGADAVEIDVRVSSDGVAYLYHDDEIQGYPVTDLEFSRIRELAGVKAPSLESILDFVDPPGFFIFDLKERRPSDIRIIAGVIAASSLQDHHVAFQSEDLAVLAQVKKMLPDSRLYYLSHLKRKFPFYRAPSVRKMVRSLAGRDIYGVSIKGRDFIDEDFLRTIKSAGYQIMVWTINDSARVRHYETLGVDGIITDAVDVIAGVNPSNPVAETICHGEDSS